MNEQAIHYEVIMRKMQPEMLERRKRSLAKLARKDVNSVTIKDQRHVVSGILAEQGLMEEDERTLVHDRVAFGESYALGDQR